MKRWLVVLALAACHGGSSTDYCQDAYHNMTRLSAFGGDTYGVDGAFTTGLSCKALMSADLVCIAKARGRDDLGKCKHAAQVIAQKDKLVHSSPDDNAQPADPASVIALSKAVCACKDLSCLVNVAQEQAVAVEGILTAGKPTDPAAVDASNQLRDCVGKLK